jgi:hypothetical protein
MAANTQTATNVWTLTAYEEQGNLFLSWQTNAPFRAQQGQIHVYSSDGFPSNPQDDTKKWTWDENGDSTSNSPWNTGLGWGTDWCCAWIAQTGGSGPYEYVVQLVTSGAAKLAVKA